MRSAFLLAALAGLSFSAPGPQRCQYCPRDAHGHIKRSAAARTHFKRDNPCPASGESKGPCPGYVIDHVKPLACGGEDIPDNMAWQGIKEAKAKDKVERKSCR